MVNSCIATGFGNDGAGKAGATFVSGLLSDWQPASKARPVSMMQRMGDKILAGMDVPLPTGVD
jgi:hypothetical protein